MQAGKFRMLLLVFSVFLVKNTEAGSPQFSDFKVEKSTGPFIKVLSLTEKQKAFTDRWQHIMQHELSNPVNFSGHYRLYLSWNGELPKECGDDRWVCGWILDKKTGEVVSTLPEFNGNTAYFSYNDNGTPRPDEFSPIFYPDSSMLWIAGTNVPAKGSGNDECSIITYNFKGNQFTPLLHAECEVDRGDDPNSHN